jgi:hypothetical protein
MSGVLPYRWSALPPFRKSQTSEQHPSHDTASDFVDVAKFTSFAFRHT